MDIKGDDLKNDMLQWRKWFRKGQVLWSVAHHSCLFGSILCSGLAGMFLQIGVEKYKDVASLLTTLAAVLTAMALSGGFERKWRSNRLSRSNIDALLLDMQDDPINTKPIRHALKEVIRAHDGEIVMEARQEKSKEGQT
jgi:hypothetical protein